MGRGIDMDKRVRWTAEMVAIAAGLRRAGFTSTMIAERLGVSKAAVRNKLRTVGSKSGLDGKAAMRGFIPAGRMTNKFIKIHEEDREL